MTCHAGEFLELGILKLWMLEDLEEWNVNVGALPHLRELEIRGCNKLKQPEGLLLMNTLKDVVLINMPGEFVANVERDLVNAFVKGITLPIAALPVRILSLSLIGISHLKVIAHSIHPVLSNYMLLSVGVICLDCCLFVSCVSNNRQRLRHRFPSLSLLIEIRIMLEIQTFL